MGSWKPQISIRTTILIGIVRTHIRNVGFQDSANEKPGFSSSTWIRPLQDKDDFVIDSIFCLDKAKSRLSSLNGNPAEVARYIDGIKEHNNVWHDMAIPRCLVLRT